MTRAVEPKEPHPLHVSEVLLAIAARVLGHLRRQGLLSDEHQMTTTRRWLHKTLTVSSSCYQRSALPRALATTSPDPRADRAGCQPPTRPARSLAPRVRCAPRTVGSRCMPTPACTLATSPACSKQRLIKYILRPPVAAERLERINDQEGGRVRVRLKRA